MLAPRDHSPTEAPPRLQGACSGAPGPCHVGPCCPLQGAAHGVLVQSRPPLDRTSERLTQEDLGVPHLPQRLWLPERVRELIGHQARPLSELLRARLGRDM